MYRILYEITENDLAGGKGCPMIGEIEALLLGSNYRDLGFRTEIVCECSRIKFSEFGYEFSDFYCLIERGYSLDIKRYLKNETLWQIKNKLINELKITQEKQNEKIINRFMENV